MRMSSGESGIGLRKAGGRFFVVVAALAAGLNGGQTQATPTGDSEVAASQAAEMALALSACPAGVAKGAAVYVLGHAGYVKVRDSRNGFTAIVQHAVPGDQEPRCMGAEGARSWLPRILMVAQLRAEGKSREEIQRLVADGSHDRRAVGT